jgi:hypothetical protein
MSAGTKVLATVEWTVGLWADEMVDRSVGWKAEQLVALSVAHSVVKSAGRLAAC